MSQSCFFFLSASPVEITDWMNEEESLILGTECIKAPAHHPMGPFDIYMSPSYSPPICSTLTYAAALIYFLLHKQAISFYLMGVDCGSIIKA